MGVKISKIVPKTELDMSMIKGRVLAVDALNTLYQFLSIIRQYDGTPLKDEHGNVTSHLSGIFYRSLNLIENGVKLVYVFDGKPPEFKHATARMRREAKEEAKAKWEAAKEEGELKDARKYAQASVEITDEILAEAKELLIALGIPVVEAPSEGEAQASYMVKNGSCYAVSSSDMDTLLFGATRLVRNLNISRKRKLAGTSIFKEVKPEMIELSQVLSTLEMSQEQLIHLGILIGTDYNPGGVKGIGPKNAIKMVSKYPSLGELMGQVEWDFDISPDEIKEFFLNPPVTDNYDSSFADKNINRDKVIEIMCDRHQFSRDRVVSKFKAIDEMKKKGMQSCLSRWG